MTISALLQLIKTRLPIIQAPMAGVQTSALAISVCKAGGLGSLPCAMLSNELITTELATIRSATDAPFNVNFFCHANPPADASREAAWRSALAPYYAEFGIDAAAIPGGAGRRPFNHELCDVIEAFKPPVVSFHFGLPSQELVDRVKRWGAVVLSSATTVAEARWLAANGADAIIAQGLEAGGHRGIFLGASEYGEHAGLLAAHPHDWSRELSTQLGTFALVPQIAAAVDVPVIATGGIANAAGVRAALALGASGVQAGTAYLLCPEATTSRLHRDALARSAAHPETHHTELTTLFTGRPARGIVNRIMRELGSLNPAAPAFPMATTAVAPLRSAAEKQGSGDFTPLWSGQNAGGCAAVSAAEITQRLAEGVRQAF
jgi:nitronate monooxygenase